MMGVRVGAAMPSCTAVKAGVTSTVSEQLVRVATTYAIEMQRREVRNSTHTR
jgi:hypothetical protein